MKPRLPGLPTMVALMLTVIISTAVTITGPIPVAYEALKDFQPLMAALIALVAATMAFRGATAKVDLDRELATRSHVKERLGLYIRLRSQMMRLQSDAGHTASYVGDKIIDAKNNHTSDVVWESEIMPLNDEYSEVDNAWAAVELMPRECARDLDKLRELLRRASILGRHDASQVEYFIARQYCLILDRITQRSGDLIDHLDRAIASMRPLD